MTGKIKHFVSTRSTAHGTIPKDRLKRIPAVFYRTEAGNEPVRDWLKAMSAVDRRLIGEDIKVIEFGWPVGMPASRPMGNGLHEVRTNLTSGRIARVFFYVDSSQWMVLLHAIVKKTNATPASDLNLARSNKRKHEEAMK